MWLQDPVFNLCFNLVQMHAIMAELWLKMWFSIWRPPPSWILLNTCSKGKSCPGTLFSVSVSNLVRIRSKIAELWPFNWFQNGGRCHLGFLHIVNFDGKCDCRAPFSTSFSTYVSNSVQMHGKMAELWPKMWFSIWRPPPSWILLDTSSEGRGSPGTLFSVSVSNLVQIRSKMAELWPFNFFSRWPPPPSWIYFRCLFLALGRLWIVAGDVSVKFCIRTWIYGWVIKLCPKKTKWRPPPSWIAIS